jgi:hypothetical protein
VAALATPWYRSRMRARLGRWWPAIAVAIAIALPACGGDRAPTPPKPPAHRAFYYWRTTFALAPAERAALTDLHVDTLYLRMFDVGWADGAPTILGPLTIPADAAPTPGVAIVPTVYLTNELFKQLPAAGVPALAALVVREVAARTAQLGGAPRELQLDCDWTDTTRARYFAFLAALRGEVAAGTALSATIRLHQIKYRERTGVPPVDRGMLMFYNMGKFSADPEARAIFDERAAARYLARLRDYPLPLDGALPIWSWVIHLRDDAVEGLMQSTDPDRAGRGRVPAPGWPRPLRGHPLDVPPWKLPAGRRHLEDRGHRPGRDPDRCRYARAAPRRDADASHDRPVRPVRKEPRPPWHRKPRPCLPDGSLARSRWRPPRSSPATPRCAISAPTPAAGAARRSKT